MALTDTEIRKSKPADKPYKLADSGGMYLLVTPAGGKLWRLKYRVEGTEKLMALGRYPEISLADARERRDAARKRLAHGRHLKRSRPSCVGTDSNPLTGFLLERN